MLSSAVIILSTVIYSAILFNFHFESLAVAANFVEKKVTYNDERQMNDNTSC